MDDYSYQKCIAAAKIASDGKQPFWKKVYDELITEGYDFKSPEHLRLAVKNKKKSCSGTKINEKFIGDSYEEGRDFINIVCSSPRVMNMDDIIEKFKINLDEWEVISFKIKTSEGYRKDRSVLWKIENGKVSEGEVNDSGKMLVVPLYHIEVRLSKKLKQIEFSNYVSDLIQDAKNFMPKNYPIPKKSNTLFGNIYEISIPDVHFGRLAWDDETGKNYDIKIAREHVLCVIKKLLGHAMYYNVTKIILPIGNDFFNSDSKNDSTTNGTPQTEDTRWRKTFRCGRELMVEIIDMCSSICNVDVIVIPGNHDEQRSFYLGDALECWYHNNENVFVDNSPTSRKYVIHGKNLIGYTHGNKEKINNLPMIMASECPQKWAESVNREWHIGHKHSKSDLVFETSVDSIGVTIRTLRSIAEADAWTFDNGFVGVPKAAESFMWHKDDGLLAQFTAKP